MTRPAGAGALSLESLRAAALAAMQNAYAPYSDFRVGAVLVGADGSTFAGCNVENSAYPAGMCAERSALAAAVAGGVRSFQLIVIATEADEATPPCGMCRQALVEFSPNLEIVSFTKHGGEATWSLSTLLPHPFTPAALIHHQ
jgi:cytidine deaminase